MTAVGAAPQVEPPATRREALHAARAARFGGHVEGSPIDHVAHHARTTGHAMRPFRFLVGARGLQDRQTLVERARAAEAAGFSDLTIHDHLTAQLGPIALLA